jgi:predicted transcriptional regulator
MLSDILRAIDTDGATISEVQFKSLISYQYLKKYLRLLIQHELIIYIKEEKRFRITQLGLHALDTYTKMDNLLVRKTLLKTIKKSEYLASFP